MPLAPAFALILIVLLVRPEGLFGRKQVSPGMTTEPQILRPTSRRSPHPTTPTAIAVDTSDVAPELGSPEVLSSASTASPGSGPSPGC